MSANESVVDDAVRLAAAEIAAAKTIVMACHVNPDGDALGSMLGLGLGLASIGKDVICISADGVPDIYSFLPGQHLLAPVESVQSWDLAIVLDSGDLERIGSALGAIKQARRLLNLDHHATAKGFGDVQLVVASAASTSEIVYGLLEFLNASVSAEVATCLFTGVTTDTGSFRFRNVTANTLDVASRLVAHGASPADISECVFDNRSLVATKLLAEALTALESTPDGRIVWTRVRYEDFVRLGASDEDTEGFVNYARNVRGAEVGLLFRELPDGSARVSLRGSQHVDVSLIAKRFGGGGHRMAAGCTVPGPLAGAESAIVSLAAEQLKAVE